MAYTATVTSASEVNYDGTQAVVIEIKNDEGTTLVSHTILADVDMIKDEIINFLREYKSKANSNKRVKEGDSWTR